MTFRVHPDMEPYRVTMGHYASKPGDPFGAFSRQGPKGATLRILASDGRDDTLSEDLRGWEHVSVSAHRCPNWEEMCWIKDLFWEPEDTVVQYHPPKSLYINESPYCLHLWRHTIMKIPLPPAILVGCND